MPEGRWIKASRHSARWPLALRWGKMVSLRGFFPKLFLDAFFLTLKHFRVRIKAPHSINAGSRAL